MYNRNNIRNNNEKISQQRKLMKPLSNFLPILFYKLATIIL